MADTTNQTPSGSNSQVSGGNSNQGVKADESTQDQVVSYETHRKLLGEKKKLAEDFQNIKARLETIEKEKEDAERKKMEEQGEYKKLLDQEREKSKTLETKLEEKDFTERNARKFAAVLNALGGNLDPKFYDLIKYDGVIINPESNEIDQTSSQKIADEFKKTYPECVKKAAHGVSMPSNSPTGSNGSLSYADWKKLPSSEMKKRLGEVMANEQKI